MRFKAGLILLLCVWPASGETLRVRLFQKELPSRVCVSAAGGVTVADAALAAMISQSPVCFENADGEVRALSSEPRASKRFHVSPRRDGDLLRIETATVRRRYPGELTLMPGGRELAVVNDVDVESYVLAVVQSEMPASWPAEALKAQAIVTRSYVLREHHRHEAQGFDLCDLAHCQVYQGLERVAAPVQNAVEGTRGQVVLFKGRAAQALFHSCCGGRTSSAGEVWKGSQAPYLAGVDDAGPGRAYCAGSPDFHWQLSLDRESLAEAVADETAGSLGALQSVRVDSRDEAGRVQKVTFVFAGGPVTRSGEDLYRRLGRRWGWHRFKSTQFEVRTRGDTVEFVGTGLGHGVGLCQWGAKGRAERGDNAAAILSAYFPNTSVGLEPASLWTRWRALFFQAPG